MPWSQPARRPCRDVTVVERLPAASRPGRRLASPFRLGGPKVLYVPRIRHVSGRGGGTCVHRLRSSCLLLRRGATTADDGDDELGRSGHGFHPQLNP
eukprot:4610452-Prymnesium_polylepis.1